MKKKKQRSPLKEKIKKIFQNNPTKQRTLKSLAKRSGYKGRKSNLQRIVKELHHEGLIQEVARGKYVVEATTSERQPQSESVAEGRVDLTRNGAGFVISDSTEQDIYVPAKHLKGAMNNDVVRVVITHTGRGGRPQGYVRDIVSRHIQDVVARLHSVGNRAYAEPIQDIGLYEIAIPLEQLDDAGEGDLVLIHITDWPKKKNKPPIGRVERVLTDYPMHEVSELSILTKYGFNYIFPREISSELHRIEKQGVNYDPNDRLDFREVLTYTIDPADAKDYDDALSYRELENGLIEIGVHIADVTHYLELNSSLDKEARRRATSVYLVGRVCPMLPETLSNDLCSLVEGEDRLTYSVIFQINDKDEVLHSRIAKTVINSDRRLAYLEAQDILDAGEGDLYPSLKRIKEFADKQRKKRNQAGAINFESQEIRFLLDEKNHPKDIYIKERKPVHLLVEDMMLLANKTVAETIWNKGHGRVPLPYRVHDEPDMEKITDLMYMARMLGFDFDINNMKQIRKSFNKLHKAARKNDAFKILEAIGIRSMAKAIYTTDNIGHFGLAFQHYVHFTSPIRRYADVLTHRMVFAFLNEKKLPYDKGRLEAICTHISRRERMAMEAQRESIKLKQAQYLEKYVGEVFSGEISGMIDRGFFVLLDGGIGEGMVSFDQFDERFRLHESGFSATGNDTGTMFAMGDRVQVRIDEVDIEQRRIEMSYVE